MMNPYETVGCKECGEQTMRCRPICGLCEADKGLFSPKTLQRVDALQIPPLNCKQECPRCGECDIHSEQEKMVFAYDALEEAGKWDQIDSTRGASRLKGKTIIDVDARAINQIIVMCSDGTKLHIDAEIGVLGIPVILIEEAK